MLPEIEKNWAYSFLWVVSYKKYMYTMCLVFQFYYLLLILFQTSMI